MDPSSSGNQHGSNTRADPPASAIVLSAVAGAVDGLGYVLLDRLFTAHITGNTVKTGADLAELDLRGALAPGFAITVFVAAAFVGALLREALARRVPRPRLVVLASSAALLLGFALAGALLSSGRAPPPGGVAFYVLAALAAASMGVQNAAKPTIAGRPVRTFITGTMVDFGETLASAATVPPPERRALLRRASALLAVWVVYLGGATLAAVAALRLGTSAALLPACAIVAALAMEWGSP